MSMRLTREDLSQLMTILDALATVPAEVKTIRVGKHEVHLDKIEDNNQRSGVSYIVRGITDRVHGDTESRDG